MYVPRVSHGDSDSLPSDVAAHRVRLARFLAEEVVPAERKNAIREESDATPDLIRWIRKRSAELGLYRLLQTTDVGGGGLGSLAAVALHETVAASGAILGRFALGGDGGLLAHGTPEQRVRFLLPVLRGELDAVLAFTDAREGPRTTAVRRGDRFLVSGVKSFVTGGARADLLVTVARVTENDGGPTGSALFVVPRAAAGVTLRREMRTLDGAVHGEFDLRDVEVPATDVIGAIGEGLPKALTGIAGLRLRVAATACGVGRWALERTLADVTRPHRSGTPLAEREQVQAMISGAETIDDDAVMKARGIALNRGIKIE